MLPCKPSQIWTNHRHSAYKWAEEAVPLCRQLPTEWDEVQDCWVSLSEKPMNTSGTMGHCTPSSGLSPPRPSWWVTQPMSEPRPQRVWGGTTQNGLGRCSSARFAFVKGCEKPWTKLDTNVYRRELENSITDSSLHASQHRGTQISSGHLSV